ncbi:MAG: PD40 domain-containing protein [Victivallales bacterium]|nr:PD40 domain-containing protein [Victivallales bacterium]
MKQHIYKWSKTFALLATFLVPLLSFGQEQNPEGTLTLPSLELPATKEGESAPSPELPATEQTNNELSLELPTTENALALPDDKAKEAQEEPKEEAKEEAKDAPATVAAEPQQAAPSKATKPAPVQDSKTDVESLHNKRISILKSYTVADTASIDGKFQTDRTIESVQWSPDGRTILFDVQGSNQFFSIASVPSLELRPKASPRILSTIRHPRNQRLNNAHPAWYTDKLEPIFSRQGKYFIFVGQDPTSNDFKVSQPGLALFTNLYICDANGAQFWQVTHDISTYSFRRGALNPQFSPDGSLLLWTRNIKQSDRDGYWGRRSINLANFLFKGNNPSINNIREFTPNGNTFYETYGFSPDGKQILFASCEEPDAWAGMDIYTMAVGDASGRPILDGKPVKLTSTPSVWDRHASFSPGGKKIIWASSEGYSISTLGPGGSRWPQAMVTELWIMNANGKDQVCLTSYNQRGSSMYAGTRCFVGATCWSPDGQKVAFVLNRQINAYSLASSVVVLELGFKKPFPGR